MARSSRAVSTMWVDERRRFPRVNAPISFGTPPPLAAVRRGGGPGLEGLRIRCPTPLRVNDELVVGLLLPSGREIRCRVRVAWSGGHRRGGVEAGLQIIDAESDLGEVWLVLEELAEPTAALAGVG